VQRRDSVGRRPQVGVVVQGGIPASTSAESDKLLAGSSESNELGLGRAGGTSEILRLVLTHGARGGGDQDEKGDGDKEESRKQ